MPADEPRRVVLLVAPSRDGATHAVSCHPPTVEHPHGFHRLVGGGVEAGESPEQALRREVREELGAQVRDLVLLDVVDNTFTVDGVAGHETVTVLAGHLDPEPGRAGAVLTEDDGTVLPVVWRPVDDAPEHLSLLPEAAVPLLQRAVQVLDRRGRAAPGEARRA